VVLEALPGRSLRTALRCGESVDPSELTAILNRLPADLLNAPPRSSWLERTRDYARIVGDAVPALAPWASELADEVVADSTKGPTVPVHGDFYEAQLFVDARPQVSGLLDVDTAGLGDRLDDLGCLVGHLSVLAEVLPQHAPSIEYQLGRCLETFDRQVDPRQLRLRTAAVVLSLATGPHRVQESGWQQATKNRLVLAERWYESAHRSHRLPLPKERNHHVRTA
jgi:Ser/Thr protein kinase RdoA (MazF antagonist)